MTNLDQPSVIPAREREYAQRAAQAVGFGSPDLYMLSHDSPPIVPTELAATLNVLKGAGETHNGARSDSDGSGSDEPIH